MTIDHDGAGTVLKISGAVNVGSTNVKIESSRLFGKLHSGTIRVDAPDQGIAVVGVFLGTIDTPTPSGASGTALGVRVAPGPGVGGVTWSVDLARP